MYTTEMLTVAQDNLNGLKAALQLRKVHPDLWNEHWINRVHKHLEYRRLFRSDESILVYVVKDAYGAGDVIFLEDEFASYMQEYHSEEAPVSWSTTTMTGREIGNLPLADD